MSYHCYPQQSEKAKKLQCISAIETPGGKRILVKNIIAQLMIRKRGILNFILLSNVSSHYKQHLQTKYSYIPSIYNIHVNLKINKLYNFQRLKISKFSYI